MVKQFGQEILLENKEINRPKLAQIIFSDNQKREELNKITCAHIAKKIKEEAKEEKRLEKLKMEARLMQLREENEKEF